MEILDVVVKLLKYADILNAWMSSYWKLANGVAGNSQIYIEVNYYIVCFDFFLLSEKL